jgi:hypothetical protein
VLAVLGRAVGKHLIDATNPIAAEPPVNGVLKYATGPNESQGEWIQAKIPATRVVKAFNSVGKAAMVNPEFSQGVPTMFLCGDSADAKGWEPYDCGGIVAARAIEPLCML